MNLKIKEYIKGEILIFKSPEEKEKMMFLVSKMLDENISLEIIAKILEIPEKKLDNFINDFIKREEKK